MHTLPTEIADSIGTSTLFAAWNAAIYVAQVEDDRLGDAVADGRYLDATSDVLRDRGGLTQCRFNVDTDPDATKLARTLRIVTLQGSRLQRNGHPERSEGSRS